MLRIVLIFLFVAKRIDAEENLIVEISDGIIEGTHQVSYDGRKYSAFEGIPYAAPPIGTDRFREPQPVEKWNGTLKSARRSECVQNYNNEIRGSEDCLYLNVYVPREGVDSNENFDVIVFIHGGGYKFGSCHGYAGPSKLMDRDVIYVNLNYRLGPLGFLSTLDDIFPGNYGLKDQAKALEWVKGNIKKFGGNPDSVTISGHSAGGASVHILSLSPLSRDLFRRVWAQSGNVLDPWAMSKDTIKFSRRLFTHLNCSAESPALTLDCMRRVSAEDIAEGLEAVYLIDSLPCCPFGPVVESLTENNKKPFITESPDKLLKNGLVSDKPFLFSLTSEEGLILAGRYNGKFDYLDDNWNRLMPLIMFYYDLEEEKQDEISTELKRFFLANESSLRSTNYMSYVRATSERAFVAGMEKSAKIQTKNSNENVYLMVFAYEGNDKSVKEQFGISGMNGVMHSYDNKFLFDVPWYNWEDLNDDEKKVKDILLDIFVSFAKNGKPKIKNITWDPMPKDGSFRYLLIEDFDKVTIKSVKSLIGHQIWDKLLPS